MADRATRVARSDVSPPAKAPRLTLGARKDEAERDAEHAARAAVSEGSRVTSIASGGASGASSSPTAPEAPPSVHAALKTPAQPLEGTTRSFMERRFGHRFSDVRVHDGPQAAASAHDIRASAYTVGKDIVFAGGRYAPSTGPGQQLLAHELAHVVQNSGMAQPSVVRRQPAGATSTAAPAAARPDYVFIMGVDDASTNKFYTSALRFYRSHIPKATFVTTIRNLTDLLSYVATNVTVPVGNMYIVAHANEDGTVAFGLNTADKDKRLGVLELRGALHPVTGTASGMAKITTQVDAKTRIHIKGCDLGRTQEIVELLDEAFGGEGTVTAPTHEQVFGNDPALEDAERARFRSEITAQHPMPDPVDPSLKGKEKAQKTKEHQADVKQRNAELKADLAAHKGEEKRVAEEAGTYESYSGPMFQHPGAKPFTSEALTKEVNGLYPHLSEPQRAAVVKGLVATDPRPAAVANKEGVHGQHGQRAYQRTLGGFKLNEPDTAAQASRLFAKELAKARFRATGTPSITKTNAAGGFTVSYVLPGELSLPKKPTQKGTLPLSYPDVIPSDATLLANGRKELPNPDKYDITLKSSHATTGVTTRTVVAERVVAYLHHGELDASPHQHFDRPESDSRFFATSKFSPKPPPPTGGAGASSGPKGPKP
jgi:hypothetical protein